MAYTTGFERSIGVPRFALTFDDGPGPSTARILDVLAAHAVRATFFICGRNLVEAPWCGGDARRAEQLVCRVLAEGHRIGNHTYSHALQLTQDGRAFLDDLDRCERALRAVRARECPTDNALFPVRLPYGLRLVTREVSGDGGDLPAAVLDPRVLFLASVGRSHTHWTTLFPDWNTQPEDAEQLARAMVRHVDENATSQLDAVLGLHDAGVGEPFGYEREATVIALGLFLREASRRRWESFVVPT